MKLFALWYTCPANIARDKRRVLVGIFSTHELAEKESANFAIAVKDVQPTFQIQECGLDAVLIEAK